MKTKVLKFGGTSLADAGQFRKVRAIIEKDPARRFVVASAPGKRTPDDTKVTDLLYRCFDQAFSGGDFAATLHQVDNRFFDIICDLSIDFDIASEIEIIRTHLKTAPQRDYMASRGEYLNSKILAAYLGWDFVDPAHCVRFDDYGHLDQDATYKMLAETLRSKEHAVIAGFYGRKADGAIKTFSRGGSDFTGAIVAAAVGADIYENWTDVSGMLAADPRIVDDPRVVEYINYRELRTLSYMGASVLHTDAVVPVAKAGIPVNIRNTNRSEDPGTTIVAKLPESAELHPMTGVAGRKGMSVVQVEKSMVSDGAGFTAVILDLFKNYHVPFEQCLTGIDTVSVIVRSDLLAPAKEKILRDIKEKLDPDVLYVEDKLSMITIVGESAGPSPGLIGRILTAVAAAGVNLSTVNQGAGALNLIIGVGEDDYEKTIKAIYQIL